MYTFIHEIFSDRRNEHYFLTAVLFKYLFGDFYPIHLRRLVLEYDNIKWKDYWLVISVVRLERIYL